MTERSAYEDDQAAAAPPVPVAETWAERGWHGSLEDLRLAGNIRERAGR